MRNRGALFAALMVAVVMLCARPAISQDQNPEQWAVADVNNATGQWQLVANSDAYDGEYLCATAVNVGTRPTPKVTWDVPSTLSTGNYYLEIWVPQLLSNTQAAQYTVCDDLGSRTFLFDQRAASGWTPLCAEAFSFSGANPQQGIVLSAATADADGSVQVIVDAVRFVPVPEPSGLVALLSGIGCLGGLVRRRVK